MKKKHVSAGLLLVLFLFCLCPTALAAPAAELSMTITDMERVGDAVEFNVVIDIAKPSEPYTSLDFNIVSSNGESLHIVDLSEQEDKSSLAFEFTPDYGGVYHKGRVNEEDGSVSYLVGLFSQESGNNIAEGTNICTVRFRYTGDSEEEVSLAGLKLIYKNSEGEIAGASTEASVNLLISQENFEQFSDDEIPLENAENEEPAAADAEEMPPSSQSPSPMVYALGALAVALVISAIALPCLRAKKTAEK